MRRGSGEDIGGLFYSRLLRNHCYRVGIPSPSSLHHLPVRVPGFVSSTQLCTVCKEHRTGCRASCSSEVWLPSESHRRVGKKVGVRAGADRPVFCRTVCDSTMCQPPTVGGGSEVRHSRAVLVNTHPLPRRNLPVTQGGEQK